LAVGNSGRSNYREAVEDAVVASSVMESHLAAPRFKPETELYPVHRHPTAPSRVYSPYVMPNRAARAPFRMPTYTFASSPQEHTFPRILAFPGVLLGTDLPPGVFAESGTLDRGVRRFQCSSILTGRVFYVRGRLLNLRKSSSGDCRLRLAGYRKGG